MKLDSCVSEIKGLTTKLEKSLKQLRMTHSGRGYASQQKACEGTLIRSRSYLKTALTLVNHWKNTSDEQS